MRVKFTIALIIVAGALILFLLAGRGTNEEVLYVAPTQFQADAALQKSRVRIKGNIVPGTVRTSSDEMHLWFDIGDDKTAVKVHYKGPAPEAFQEGLEAVVDGRMGSQGAFECRELVVKCPSKYESKPGTHPEAPPRNST
jgi:cytochrome c-type biogenesis protein CcmE